MIVNSSWDRELSPDDHCMANIGLMIEDMIRIIIHSFLKYAAQCFSQSSTQSSEKLMMVNEGC